MARREDQRFLTGRGAFTGDRREDGLLHAQLVRSGVAHGRIVGIDAAEARAWPGVVAVLTAADLDGDGLPDLPCGVDPRRDDGGTAIATPRPWLARDAVRFVGEPVAMVIAETATAAADAAEHVAVAYDDLPHVVDQDDAGAAGAPAVWPGTTDNIAFVHRLGDADGARAAFAAAAHVVRLDLDISRVVAASLEPRVALGMVDRDGRLVLRTSTQNPFAVRNRLSADMFGLDPLRLRVIAPDVGGSFGMKGSASREDGLVLWAARRLGRPVLWTSSRAEAFLSDEHARDVRARAALALDADGMFLALEIALRVNIGAYLSRRSLFMLNNLGGVAGVYRTPAISAEVTGIFTNTSPTAPYRGAGRPEATCVIERLIDVAARETGIDPFALRHRNLIPPEAMPFQTALTFRYDSGDFAATMARAAALADLDGFAARRRATEKRGRLRGIGIANPIEVAGGPLRQLRKDEAWIRIDGDGAVELRPGVMSVGQGHETGLSRMAARRLGVPAEAVTYRQGDTDLLASGRGSGGSGALIVGGAAVTRAIETLVEKGRGIAAERFESSAADVAFDHGRYHVAGTDLSMTLAAAARRGADGEQGAPGLAAGAEFLPEDVTYPNGCHICEVEIDPETGAVEIVRYVAVEDVGTVLEPVLVEGQMQGGIAQGVGQALGERIVYDRETGQLLTGSFLDYRMPIAADMPAPVLETLAVPTAVNPLGAKGVGEAGTVGSLAATMNAVCDALAPLGVGHLDMPASPDRVWRAIADAKRPARPGS